MAASAGAKEFIYHLFEGLGLQMKDPIDKDSSECIQQ